MIAIVNQIVKVKYISQKLLLIRLRRFKIRKKYLTLGYLTFKYDENN